jgi:DNA-directed RNA polymerase II subunit RPB1
MVLDPSPLLRRGLTPPLVADMVERRLTDVHVCCSERQHAEWILRVRPAAVALDGLHCAPGSVEERVFLRDSTEALAHRLCRDVMLSGITGVASAAAQRGMLAAVDARGDFTTHPTTFLDTVGSNLRAALTLPELFVAAHCTSNDVHDVLVTLGVEAAARVLFEELRHVLSFDGMYIDDRHLLLLVNTMTRDGGLLPISRHGINRSSDTGALTRASFEEIGEVFMVSAAYGDVDPVRDVAPHIMLGQRLRIGTGVVEVVDAGVSVPERAERSEKVEAVAKKALDEKSDDEEEVIFTSVEGEVEAMTTMFPPAPELERPYLEAQERDSVVPFSSGGMRLEAPFSVSRPQTYAPTSPKHVLRDVLNFKPEAPASSTTSSARSDRKRKLTQS